MNISPVTLTSSCLAFVLAGGRGSRLHELTEVECKPAVSFAGSSRIVDFALANIVNSGINKALVATQYQPAKLISHIRSRWRARFAAHGGMIECLNSGSQTEDRGYRGTADAVARNIAAIDAIAPRHVLVVAADHIYQMDYAAMIQAHVETGADVTIAADIVPRADATAFGVLGVSRRGRVADFAEKPKNPPSLPEDQDRSLASMGIYVFDWLLLREKLFADLRDTRSSHDFGKDLLPKLIADGNAFVHRLKAPGPTGNTDGYWRDVGTVDALHAAHMDLLAPKGDNALDLEAWPLHVGWIGEPSPDRDLETFSLVYPGAEGKTSFLAQSLVGPLATLKSGASLDRSVIMPGARLDGPIRLANAIVAPGTQIVGSLVAGEDAEEDAAWFRRTESGVVLIDQAMVDRRDSSRRRVKGWTSAAKPIPRFLFKPGLSNS